MPVQVRPVETQRDLRQYVRLPFQLYQHDPYWIPPLLLHEYEFYNPRHNFNLATNPYQLFLAEASGKVLGRIMVLINERANEFRKEKLVRWTALDAPDNPEVVHALLREAENWGKFRGMTHAVGPRGFSDQEPQGALVEGFEERSLIAAHYNRPFLIRYIEHAGYAKDVDWICYRLPVPAQLPRSFRNMQLRLQKRGFTCRNFRRKSELRPYIIPVLKLLNETYQDLAGFAPLSPEEFEALAQKYLPLLDPRFVHLIENEGQLLGFSVVMPDITRGLQKARGRLLPFGCFHLWRAGRTADTLQLLLIGIREAHRNKGLFTLFADALLREVRAAGITTVHSHLQLEHNTNMNQWMERLGGQIFRRYRAFVKPL